MALATALLACALALEPLPQSTVNMVSTDNSNSQAPLVNARAVPQLRNTSGSTAFADSTALAAGADARIIGLADIGSALFERCAPKSPVKQSRLEADNSFHPALQSAPWLAPSAHELIIHIAAHTAAYDSNDWLNPFPTPRIQRA